MHGRGICGGMCGGVYMAGGGGMHGNRGVHGRGACVVGEHAWQEGHVWHACPPSRYYAIRSMSGRYSSYWNAFLLNNFSELMTNLLFSCVNRSRFKGRSLRILNHFVPCW